MRTVCSFFTYKREVRNNYNCNQNRNELVYFNKVGKKVTLKKRYTMVNNIINVLNEVSIIRKEDNKAIKCSDKGLIESKIKKRKYSARYASEVMLEDKLPVGYIDKTVCGCGLTTVALENKYSTVIAVPSKNLLDNKQQQYSIKEDYPYELFIIKGGVSLKEIEEYVKRVSVIKIMVTYDSLYKVEDILDSIDSLVIDEAQELTNLIDLKSSDKRNPIDVITKLYTIAYKHRDKVSFITATPIPLDYEPDWMCDLDYHKIEWDNTIKVKPMLMETSFPVKSVIDKIVAPIKLNGYAELVNSSNEVVQVKKTIIFINSVSTILTICKKANLKPNEVGFIVGESLENDIRLNKYNRIRDPKNLPTFTFITSCGYSGIDLYDKEALTIIISNIGKTYTMIDILTDLKQAASRQRDMSNPFINTFLYVYKVNPFSNGLDTLKELIKSNKEEVIRATNQANELINLNVNKYLSGKLTKEEFKAEINTTLKFKIGHATFNKYSLLSETNTSIEVTLNERLFMADKYRIEQTYLQYQKGFDIQGSLDGDEITTKTEIKLFNYADLAKKIIATSKSKRRQVLDSYSNMYPDYVETISKLLDSNLKIYYNYTTAIKALESSNSNDFKSKIFKDIIDKFKIGELYILSDIKDILSIIYLKHGISNKPKATYIQEVFEVKNITITINSKRNKGYKIIKIK